MPSSILRRAAAALVVLLIAIAAVDLGANLVLIVDDDGKPDRVVVRPPTQQVPTTAKVDADADGKIDDRLTVDPDVAADVEQSINDSGQAELNAPLREPNDTPATTTVPGPLAADEVPGCRTRFVGNASSRGGVRPQVIVWHQTVSRERGWPSQDALTAMAARLSSGVSWHLLVGRSNGLCTYTVPLALKAWTQANANPFSVGIEVEAYGDEGPYVTGAGKSRLLSVTRHIGRRYGIPMRRGLVRDCRVVRSGIVEHVDLGACGGGHVDVTLAGVDALIAELARTAATSARLRGYWTPTERQIIRRHANTRKGTPAHKTARRDACLARKRVWRAAQGEGGWSEHNRRTRYRTLRARSTKAC